MPVSGSLASLSLELPVQPDPDIVDARVLVTEELTMTEVYQAGLDAESLVDLEPERDLRHERPSRRLDGVGADARRVHRLD